MTARKPLPFKQIVSVTERTLTMVAPGVRDRYLARVQGDGMVARTTRRAINNGYKWCMKHPRATGYGVATLQACHNVYTAPGRWLQAAALHLPPKAIKRRQAPQQRPAPQQQQPRPPSDQPTTPAA